MARRKSRAYRIHEVTIELQDGSWVTEVMNVNDALRKHTWTMRRVVSRKRRRDLEK